MYDYDFKVPDTPFKGMKFGIEWEIPLNDELMDHYEHKRHIVSDGHIVGYIKEDGSVFGIEVVTTARPYSEVMSLIPVLWDKCPKGNGKSAGLHVHVGRNHFSHRHLQRLDKFQKANGQLLNFIAGRKPNNYQMVDERPMVYMDRLWFSGKVDVKCREFKYNRIALRTNTVEFRLFDSPRTIEEFVYRMEFVRALVDFVYLYPMSRQTSKHFRGYVSKKRKVYPNLYKKLKTFHE